MSDKEEVGEMALGILDGKPFDSPIHEGILLTCVCLNFYHMMILINQSFLGKCFMGS